MSPTARRFTKSARVLLVALLLTGAAGATPTTDPVASTRAGLATLAPALQCASLLPYLGSLLGRLLEPAPEPESNLDRLFEDTFSGDRGPAVSAGASLDPEVDEFGFDDLHLLEF